MAQSAVYGGRLGYQPHSLLRTKRTRFPLDSDQVQFLIGRDGRYSRHQSARDPTLPAVPEWGQLRRDTPPEPAKTPSRKMGEAVGEYVVEKSKKALSREAGSAAVKVSLDAIMPGSSQDIVSQANIDFGMRNLTATLALKQAIAGEYEKRAITGKLIGTTKSLSEITKEATTEGGTEAGRIVQDIVVSVQKAIAAEKSAIAPVLPPLHLLKEETAVTPASSAAQPEPPVAQPEVTPTATGGSLVDKLVGFIRTPVGIVGTVAVAYLLLRKK